jgi:cytochrome oxidase Cu insertion factor (SCO1/SenC/PrrC family)
MHTGRMRKWAAGLVLGCAALLSGAAAAIEVGDKAPAFAAPASNGKEIKLADFAGKQNVVLFFYIGAFTDS